MDNQPERELSSTGVSLVAHTLWGIYPVLAKLLFGGFGVPPLVFIATGQTMTVLTSAIVARRHLRWSFFVRPAVIAFGLATAGRAILNILAISFTLAIYVQLINLLAPFVVAILASLLLREQPPQHTFKATLIATLGAVLVLVGDPREVQLQWGTTDALGIGLALASVLMWALWALLARFNTNERGLHPMAALVAQSSGVVVVSATASLALGHDWGIWGRLPLAGWGLFLTIVALVQVGGNLFQITALSRVRAAFYSSLMAWRLVIALVLGALLLGERLESAWQVFGAVVVVVTVTLYLWQRTEVAPEVPAEAVPPGTD